MELDVYRDILFLGSKYRTLQNGTNGEYLNLIVATMDEERINLHVRVSI